MRVILLLISFQAANLAKHRVSEEDALYVFRARATVEQLRPSRQGNDRILMVGWDTSGARYLEIGIEFIGDEMLYIFHAERVF